MSPDPLDRLRRSEAFAEDLEGLTARAPQPVAVDRRRAAPAPRAAGQLWTERFDLTLRRPFISPSSAAG